MTSILCKCKQKISYGEIPCSHEYLFISDVAYDKYDEYIHWKKLYFEMKSILKCEYCGRLWVFRDGFENAPISYLPESD